MSCLQAAVPAPTWMPAACCNCAANFQAKFSKHRFRQKKPSFPLQATLCPAPAGTPGSPRTPHTAVRARTAPRTSRHDHKAPWKGPTRGEAQRPSDPPVSQVAAPQSRRHFPARTVSCSLPLHPAPLDLAENPQQVAPQHFTWSQLSPRRRPAPPGARPAHLPAPRPVACWCQAVELAGPGATSLLL